ncbi:MAG: ABC transporter permease [Verrucomicrobia bacterium]|nr:ABC transporter permease [Verrucomicrobiota bacterium]
MAGESQPSPLAGALTAKAIDATPGGSLIRRPRRTEPVSLWRLLWRAALGLCRGHWLSRTVIRDECLRQLDELGLRAIPVVVIVSIMISCTVVFLALGRYAAFYENHFPGFYGRIFIEQVAPLLTAYLVIGRSIVGMAAELAGMRISQETDSLEAIGVDPGDFLLLPRALALLVAMPALTLCSVYAAAVGGTLGASWRGSRSAPVFFDAFFAGTAWETLGLIVVRASVCALLMALFGGYFGLQADASRQGAVGLAARRAVVCSMLGVTAINMAFAVS